jgi:hypothetical protein
LYFFIPCVLKESYIRMGFIGHCRIVGFECNMINIKLVAQRTEFYMVVSDILSIIIALFHSLCA